MAGVITQIHSFPTVNNALAPDLARGMCFTGGGNIYLAIPNNTLLALSKTTGSVIFATVANNLQFKMLYDPVTNQFFGSSGGGAPNFKVSRYTGGGVLIDNPIVGGSNPYGQIVINGHYWTANDGVGSNNMTELDAATAATLVSSLAIPAGQPSSGTGVIVADTSGNLWVCSINSFLTQIDEASATVANTFDFTGQGVGRFGGLCFQGGFLWGTDFLNLNLVKMNLVGAVVASFPLSTCGSAGPIIFDGSYFWVLDFGNCVSVYDAAGTFQAQTAIAGAAQDIASDPVDGPGFAWVTSGGPPFQVQQFQFTPSGVAGVFEGTFKAFFTGGKFGGGTK